MLRPPVEVISDKLIMFHEGLPTSNSSRQIDHPKCTTLTKVTVVLNVMLQNYFKDLLLDDVICAIFSSGSSESTKSTFTVSRYIKEPPTVLKILFQRGGYDSTTLMATKINLKLLYLLNIFSNNHKVIRRYHTPQFH